MTQPTAPAPPEVSPSPPAEALLDRGARPAAIVFGAYVAIAVPLLLFVLGNDRWFMFDDWEFVAGRTGGDLGDLFRPHYQHWTTLPLLAYRLIWNVVGARSYTAYQVPVVLAHLTSAVLLRVVMRRAGVGPWIATCAASIFVLFGSAEQNIVWAFQVTLVGALMFGLGQLVLADHDGPIDWRDGAGLLAGLAALMCSGVAVTMVIVVGVAMLLSRGWRVALLQTVPLGAIFLLWATIGNADLNSQPFGPPTVGDVVEFVWDGIADTFGSIGYYRGVGLLLGLVLVVGCLLAWVPLGLAEFRKRAAGPLAMLVGAALLLAIVGYGRSWFAGPAERNQHLVAALVLPALAVGADAIARRWRVVAPVMVVLLLVGIPANIAEFGTDGVFVKPYFDARKQLVLGLAHAERAAETPGWVHPDLGLQGGALTVGWLRAALAAGDLPDAPEIDPSIRDEFPVRLGVAQHDRQPDGDNCKVYNEPIELNPDLGDVWGIGSPTVISVTEGFAKPPGSVTFAPISGGVLSIELDDLHLRLSPPSGADAFIFCR